MPIAFCCPPVSRMILRPDPPSSPCSCTTRSTGAWKCCSNRFLRTSIKVSFGDSAYPCQSPKEHRLAHLGDLLGFPVNRTGTGLVQRKLGDGSLIVMFEVYCPP